MNLTLCDTQGDVCKKTILFCIHSFNNFEEISGRENPKVACHYFFYLRILRNLKLENMSHSILPQEKQLNRIAQFYQSLLFLFNEHKLHCGNKVTFRLSVPYITKDELALNGLPINFVSSGKQLHLSRLCFLVCEMRQLDYAMFNVPRGQIMV